MKPFHSDLQFSGHELVWLNALGRAQQPLEGRGCEGGGSQANCSPFSSGPEARLQLRMTQGGRTAGREVGMRWSLQNVKHGVGGGFV